MTTDLELIKQLEKEIGQELKQREFDEIDDVLENGFAVDENGHVIGLNMDEIRLGSLPAALLILSEFKHLKMLRLIGTELTDISFLKGLRNLREIDLGGNKITDISFLQGLRNLKMLNLINNEIRELPEAIVDMGMEIVLDPSPQQRNRIFLYDNPLEKPPIEIINKGKDAIKAWFKSLEGEKQSLKEVKVLLVGDGGAGKTSLMKQLLGEKFEKDESQTHGINIEHWGIKVGKSDITVHFWDFGGQEIMHSTHQFFMSRRSLYILVLDGRKDEKTSVSNSTY